MKRFVMCGLCFVLLQSVLAFGITSNVAPPSKQALKIADAVSKLDTGDNSVVALRLQNKTVIKGTLTEVGPDAFVVTDNETGDQHRVPYGVVAQLHGYSLVNGKQVHVGGGFRAKVMAVATRLLPVHPQMSNNLTNTEKTLLIAGLIGLLVGILLAAAL